MFTGNSYETAMFSQIFIFFINIHEGLAPRHSQWCTCISIFMSLVNKSFLLFFFFVAQSLPTSLLTSEQQNSQGVIYAQYSTGVCSLLWLQEIWKLLNHKLVIILNSHIIHGSSFQHFCYHFMPCFMVRIWCEIQIA